MPVLSDVDIKYELEQGYLIIEGVDMFSECIQPASVDLKLNGDYIEFKKDGLYPLYNVEEYILQPHEFILASTEEYVEIPRYLVGQVDGKSTWGRKGLAVHITAGYIDPAFRGRITLELYNHSPLPISLKQGEYICQLILMDLRTQCRDGYDGKYQGQPTVQRAVE